MNSINRGDIVRLNSGETCKVTGLPGSFMSNGSYEVVEVESSGSGKYVEKTKKTWSRTLAGDKLIDVTEKKWVKPEDIAYSLTTTDHTDPITNYFETVYGEEGEIYIIPKDLKSVELVTDENGFKTIRLHYEDHLHNTVNILIGENEIKNEKGIN